MLEYRNFTAIRLKGVSVYKTDGSAPSENETKGILLFTYI